MDTALIVLKQIITMFLYMFAGFVLVISGKLSIRGSKDLATLLLWLIIPAMLVNSFCVGFSREKLVELCLSSLLGALSLLLAILLSRLLLHKSSIEEFATAFSNAGFIGIPLVTASLGSEAVFYIVGFTALLNILQWTYGVFLLTGDKKAISLKGILLNPILIASFIGFLLFISGLGTRLPSVVGGAIRGLASLNAPIAMIVLGVYFAQVNIQEMFLNTRLYWLSAVRLIIIPFLTLILFRILGFSTDMNLAVLLASAAPVGANVAVYAQIHNLDYPYACQTVVLTTFLSVFSLPFVILVAGYLL